MTIRFTCIECNNVLEAKDEDENATCKCSCGAVLAVPSSEALSDITHSTTEPSNSCLSNSMLATAIAISAVVLAISFICGAVITRPDKDRVAAQVKEIEQDISSIRNEVVIV